MSRLRFGVCFVFADYEAGDLVPYFKDPTIPMFRPALIEPLIEAWIVRTQAREDCMISANLIRHVLIVTRLDRLARSTRDLLNVLAAITERGAGFRSLKDAWCDTTTPHGRLMLTVLGGLGEFERELIKARTGEGRERAKAKGVRFGRPLKMSAHQRREALERLNAGDSVVDVASTFGVDCATLYRLQAAARPATDI